MKIIITDFLASLSCFQKLISSYLPRSQSDQQLHYSTADAPYSTKPMSMTLPLHPSLLEHYLPRSLEPPQAPRGPEEPDGPRSKPPYSEGEESDAGERSEGELVVLTDWQTGGTRVQGAVRWNVRVSGLTCFHVSRAHSSPWSESLLFLDDFTPVLMTMLRDGLLKNASYLQ